MVDKGNPPRRIPLLPGLDVVRNVAMNRPRGGLGGAKRARSSARLS